METTILGLVHSFRVENGFGLLELEDGRKLHFDVAQCIEEPLAGQEVRVVLGTGLDGELKPVLVEPADEPSSTRPATTLREAVRRLQAEGLALELDDYEIDKLVANLALTGSLPEELVDVLYAYYSDEFVGARRRHADRFVAWRIHEDPRVVERALTELLGDEATLFSSGEINVRSIHDIVDAYNEELRATGDARRIVPLESLRRYPAYFCMSLARAMRLSIVGVLRVDWHRPHLTPSEPPPRFA